MLISNKYPKYSLAEYFNEFNSPLKVLSISDPPASLPFSITDMTKIPGTVD